VVVSRSLRCPRICSKTEFSSVGASHSLLDGVIVQDGHNGTEDLLFNDTWVNTWGESPAEMAVGGWKKSGLGVENGRRGIEAWLQNLIVALELFYIPYILCSLLFVSYIA
jgi:hypothetical protein